MRLQFLRVYRYPDSDKGGNGTAGTPTKDQQTTNNNNRDDNSDSQNDTGKSFSVKGNSAEGILEFPSKEIADAFIKEFQEKQKQSDNKEPDDKDTKDKANSDKPKDKDSDSDRKEYNNVIFKQGRESAFKKIAKELGLKGDINQKKVEEFIHKTLENKDAYDEYVNSKKTDIEKQIESYTSQISELQEEIESIKDRNQLLQSFVEKQAIETTLLLEAKKQGAVNPELIASYLETHMGLYIDYDAFLESLKTNNPKVPIKSSHSEEEVDVKGLIEQLKGTKGYENQFAIPTAQGSGGNNQSNGKLQNNIIGIDRLDQSIKKEMESLKL
jgi:hypothetical protein